MNKNIALRGIFFLGMPGRKGFPFRATNKYIWYTLVKEVATALKADLMSGNCPSYLFFSH